MNTNALAHTLTHQQPHAGAYEHLDVPALSRAGLIDALTAVDRLLAHIQALQFRLLATLAQARTQNPLDCTEEETTAALH